MVRVYLKKQSNHSVNTVKIKRELRDFLEKWGLISDFSVNVSLVGEKTMKDISKKFLSENDSLHSVLSFPESEVRGDFEYPPDLPIPLGEIIICYPEVVKEANQEGKLIDEKVIDLVKHGAEHLLGKHHSEN